MIIFLSLNFNFYGKSNPTTITKKKLVNKINKYLFNGGNIDSQPLNTNNNNIHHVNRFNFIHYLIRNCLVNFIEDKDVLDTITSIFSTIAWFYIILSILGTIGFDTKPLLSLLGIGGITLGFSLKDILTDLYSGLFVLFTKPFQRGSMIRINNYYGKVISIDIRYVKIYDEKDNSEILLPLSLVHKNAIKINKDVIESTKTS